MIDITIEHKLSAESDRIVEALHGVKCAQDVFEALCEVPSQNLQDMIDMINYILNKRNNKS